ncbi:MAG: DUF2294 domain-containing protein [Thermoanaerobacteraceae bacterium]|nr:DUF2294 domain-containing protein [Thermoanaerobacteraceae bacterium]
MTKGQLEHQLSNKLNKFLKVHLGRGPKDVKTKVIADMIVVRAMGLLNNAEKELSRSDSEGPDLVRSLKLKLLQIYANNLKLLVDDITGEEVVSIQKDFDTTKDEMMLVFILKDNLEETLEISNRQVV